MTVLYAVHWKQGTQVGGALLTDDGAALWQATSGTVEDSMTDLTKRNGHAGMLAQMFPDLTVVQTPWTDAPLRLIRAVMERAEVNARAFLDGREAANPVLMRFDCNGVGSAHIAPGLRLIVKPCERCGERSDDPLADGLCEGCTEAEREAGPNVPYGHTDTRI